MVQTNGLYINKNSMLDKGLVEIVGAIGGALGIYTEKRALEILDEIQDFIEKKCTKHISSSGMFYEKYVVYEMPSE